VRAGDAALALGAMRGALEGRGIRPQVFFLEARDEVLIRRFSETRHRHPLADQRGIASSIVEERRRLDPVRSEADVVIDTSDLSLRELREKIFTRIGDAPAADRLAIQLISFGFKYGVPLEADLVFDVRFMQNPYYIEELRQLSGLTEAVRDYVLGQPIAQEFLRYLKEFLKFALPAYIGEGKTRLTIALGCTGGYHRSIALSEALAVWLREQDFGPVAVFHRELERA
jgi:RNase adapter protein RapZ